MNNKLIRQAQEALIVLGYLSGTADGKFDKSTQDAVLRFRRAEGLKRTNIISQPLMPYFEAATLKKLQTNLKTLGYANGVTGKLDKATIAAIKTYQKNNKLRQSGEYSHVLLAKTNRAAREREQARNRRAPVSVQNNIGTSSRSNDVVISSRNIPSQSNSSKASAMPNLNNRTVQENEIMRSEPNTAIQGKMRILKGSNGQVTGCKISTITISSDWCTSGNNKEGSQCNVLYKNGRVLSVRCR
ncbi:hypothetical protein AwWohl_10280 [Gammaproteobacteria bacterium]|nr:hypothetical protein AwWohl_10280 [Gammaproteobacteria bacterium]